MSCLDIPRIHFNGKFSTNVCTSNNDDVTAVADKFKPVINPFNVTLNKNILAMNNGQVGEFFRSLTSDGSQLNGGWNHFGDHVIEFRDATVSQVVAEIGGAPVGYSKLLNGSVTLPNSPKMVDVDPTGSANTQLFLGGFQLGDFSNGIYFSDPGGVVSYDRWIGERVPSESAFTAFAATWQFGIPNGSALKYFGDDPALAKLQEKADKGDGLLVQFCIYLMQPHFSTSQLAQLYADGNYAQNPAIGQMVGTVGVWNKGELSTFPNGRQLVATQTGAQNAIGSGAVSINADKTYASLNLITAFPEQMTAAPAAVTRGARAVPAQAHKMPSKIGFGTVDLVCTSHSGDVTAIASVAGYDDYDAYRACAGIVDVKLDQNALKGLDLDDCDLGLQSSMRGQIMVEEPLTVATDQHSAYLSLDTPSQMISLQVRLRDKPFEGTLGATARISESSYSWNHFLPSKDAARMVVHTKGGTSQIPNALHRVPPTPVEFAVEDGEVHVELSRNTNGETLTFGFTFTDVATGEDAASSIGVRLYLDENFAGAPTWDEVYNEVLRYYALTFPAMNLRIDLADETVVRANAEKILVSLDQPFTSPYYMPVTRSMSPDRRQLLRDWLSGPSV